MRVGLGVGVWWAGAISAISGVGCVPKAPSPAVQTPGVTLVEMQTGDVAVGEKAAITSVLSQAAVRPCFESLLAAKPDAHGEVVVRFTIGTSGIVEESVPAFGTLGDGDAEACVAAAVGALQFPGRTEALTVRYPYLLITERTPPEVARALKERYGLLSGQELDPSGDPRTAPPPGIVVVW